MKKLFFFLAFFGVLALVDVNAQQCSSMKSVSANKQSCAATCAKTAAAKAASMDVNIEKRVHPVSQQVSYVRKSVCPASGNVSYDNVEYCTKSKQFINVSPTKANMQTKSCTKDVKGVKAIKASSTTPKTSCTAAQKAACAKTCTAAQKAACMDAKASSTAKSNAQVKLVKNNQ